MWKWLALIIAGYLLYRMFANDMTKKKKDVKEDKEHLIATGEMVKDPICGAYVDADGGVTVRDGERTYRFCSYECRDKFIKQLQDGGREIPQIKKEEE
ncbi:MAG: transcriptional regulator [Pseudomonadota bacterium]